MESRGPAHKKSSRFSSAYRPVSDINVTPFIDIMLVLLVVFMITAPLLSSGVKVDLPKTKASGLEEKDKPLVITLDEKGGLYVQDLPVEQQNLLPKLEAMTARNHEATLYIKADRRISYGQVMKVMGLISDGGFSKVALVSLPAGTSALA